jgi:hypothetical protein
MALNVLDNNLNTAWSNNAAGSWIQADLGGQKAICSLDLAWYRGDQVKYNFIISVSNDGTTFTNVFAGKSSGVTLSYETYFLQGGTEGRYVRITVNGHNANGLVGIAELSLYGYGYAPTSPQLAPTGDNMNISRQPTPAVDNKNVQTDTSTPVQITLTGTDPVQGDLLRFAVLKLPQHGTLRPGNGSDTVTYVPNSEFNGTDSFTYKAANGQGVDSNTGTVTVAINAPALASSTANCAKLSIAGVTASGSEDGNVPTNVLDNNLNTRWSNLGIGSFIRADLGGQKTICSVDIAWYRGNLRINNFVISVSNDGTTFRNVFSGKSSGKTLSPEIYILPSGTTGRYVKVTVNGNTENNWASITELSVYGSSVVPPSGTLDKFGIKELYPSKTGGGEQYIMNMQSESNDPQFDPNGNTLTKNADGSYKVTSSSVRLQIFTSTGFQENQIKTLNQVKLASQGYMLRPNDWKNVEITGYLKPNHFTSSTSNGAAHIEYVARGARNTNDNYLVGTPPLSAQCEATTYHSNTYMTGRVKFEKDLMHTAGYTANSQDPQILNAVNMALGKWVGIKAVYYNLPNGNVKLEQWVDDSTDNINAPGNKWHKVLDFTDQGQWGGGHPNCGGTPSTIITWGGPIALFRWDNIDNMDFKNFSIREIQPPQ